MLSWAALAVKGYIVIFTSSLGQTSPYHRISLHCSACGLKELVKIKSFQTFLNWKFTIHSPRKTSLASRTCENKEFQN